MKLRVLFVAFIAFIGVTTNGCATQLNATFIGTALHRRAPITAHHCAEDEPCWDCHTMGNHICGKP